MHRPNFDDDCGVVGVNDDSRFLLYTAPDGAVKAGDLIALYFVLTMYTEKHSTFFYTLTDWAPPEAR